MRVSKRWRGGAGSFGSYLADRAVTIACWLCATGIVAVILTYTAVNRGILLLAACTLLGALVLALGIGYASHRRFWASVSAIADEDVSPIDAAQDLPYPANGAERAVDAAFVAVARAAADGIARSRRDAADYRAFVEAWSHEVKTPIHAATLLAAGDPTPSGQAIAGELERVDGYVEQALYYARSTSVDRDFSVRLAPLAQIVTETLHAKTNLLLSQSVGVRLGDLGFSVLCDAKWVRFMLGQLVDNACKYRDPNRPQTLTFTARREHGGTADERVILDVVDCGLGIPAADLPRIFDKGFVGENGRRAGQAASTGIGLYLVRLLAEKTGLGVHVRSAEGEGATFSLVFPMNRMRYLER